MQESDFQQARLNLIAGKLHERIAEFCVGRPCDAATVLAIKEMVDETRTYARLREGIEFPASHVIAFPRLGAIEIVRQDLDERSLQTWIVNLTVRYPAITPMEIARAVSDAFPEHRVDPTQRRPRRAMQ